MVIQNGSVFFDGAYHDVDVEILDGVITQIGEHLSGDDSIDAAGKLVFPGFIETHIHGADFVSCNDGEEAVRRICKALPQYGVTSFTPTPTTNNVADSLHAVRGIRAAKGAEGADILGIHYYGPYRNRSIDYYKDNVSPTKEHTLAMMDNDLSDVKIMLVASELPGGMDWIKWATDQGIIVIIGFTEGTTSQIYQAADNGATLTDHFYNGFPLMDHHEEGSTVGCMLEDRLYCQLNFDHIHVAEPFIRLLMRVKGKDKIVAVSDCSTYVGAPDGEYWRGDLRLIKKDGAVRTAEGGKLVTGCHSFDENMRTVLDKGYTLEEIGTMFTENAGKMLRLTDRGKIAVGRRGDIVIMDQALNVEKTLMLGQIVYEK
ncbi:amidohydrolase family protein [Eubacteriales bacterium OttesenSCG-928-M02]|nr:amidohydrolase family protein [Eubacteriales bacterium OttesenSCG-928-M02]